MEEDEDEMDGADDTGEEEEEELEVDYGSFDDEPDEDMMMGDEDVASVHKEADPAAHPIASQVSAPASSRSARQRSHKPSRKRSCPKTHK
eukprot:7376116-Prymnesium_polylepis.1